MVMIVMLFQGLTLIGVEPKPASFSVLGVAFGILAFPALEPLVQGLNPSSSWLEWAILPINSVLAALLLKLAWSVMARLRGRVQSRAA